MVHLFNKAIKYFSRRCGYNFNIETLLFRRRFSVQRNALSALSRINANVPSSNRHGPFQLQNKCCDLKDIHGITKRWYTPTSDHAKNFNFIADAVEVASPAVVYVDVKIQQQGGLFGGGGVAQGAGSGFIVTDYGVILTNAHVVNNATSVAVKLASNDVSASLIDQNLAVHKVCCYC